ncbi:MAG: hypothetical protein E7225_06020 [Clostridiales bacterium]|nr:hypothetical protein [Clostridiales bacterium]
MTIFKDYFNDYLYSAEEKLHALKSENALLVPGTLWVEHRNGKLLHYHVTNTDSGKKRHLITRDKELLSLLARKIYIEKEIEVLNGNIKLISKAKADIEKHFMSEDVNSILSYISNSNQRKAYLDYFSLPDNPCHKMPIDYSRYSLEIIKWANEDYNRSNYMPERLMNITSRGLLVRSKSEVGIIEQVYGYRVPFHYEEIIERNGIRVVPDLILPDVRGNFWIWEHAGMMNNPEYRNRHKMKMEKYELLGYYPWKNMIVTYDDEYGHINMKTIRSEIESKLL